VEEKPSIPDIAPMRRGRLANPAAEPPGQRPSPSPMRGIASDPWASLDAAPNTASDNVLFDDVAARFPPLDQFSILQDSGNKFAFDQKSPVTSPPVNDISRRVTEALADDAFATPVKPTTEPLTHSISVPTSSGTHVRAQPSISRHPLPTAPKPLVAQQQRPVQQQVPAQHGMPQKPVMISTGTMTSPEPAPPAEKAAIPSSRPIYRFLPVDQRSSSQPRTSERPRLAESNPERDNLLPHRPSLADHRSKSQAPTISGLKSSASARPSLDGNRPVNIEYEGSLTRSRTTNSRNRPVSAHIEPSNKLVFPRSRSRGTPKLEAQKIAPRDFEGEPLELTANPSDEETEPTKIESNVDFLRAMEEEDPNKRKEKRNSNGSKHVKRASMPSISLSGTKSLLAGRFGEAFRRFETNTSNPNPRDSSAQDEHRASELTPIAGSEATDGRSDDGEALDESMEAPPEVRRELERRRLSQEERRVAEAAAAYKQRVTKMGPESGRGRRDGSRAALIQNKVQALLVENGKASPTKTAEGYGRYTDQPVRQSQPLSSSPSKIHGDLPISRHREAPTNTSSAPPVDRPFSRPSAPPKPQALRTGGRGEPVGSLPDRTISSAVRTKQSLDGASNDEDWETDFGKRYPSLSGIEMVETTIDKNGAVITTKDVGAGS